MDQQPDKLFRDKLQGYDSPVPPQAWSRVSSNVGSRHRTTWWLSAAAVALIGSAAMLLYPLRKESAQLAETATRVPPREQPPTINERNETVAEQKQAITKTERVAEERAAGEHPSGKQISARPKRMQAKVEQTQLPVVTLPEPQPVAIAKEESMPPSVIDETNAKKNSDRKTITIVFSAKEVNEKYLSKQDPVHATSAEEEASTLKNMLDKAYDLTHNQSPLGELRQKKNEILAMNFRKDKPRTQND